MSFASLKLLDQFAGSFDFGLDSTERIILLLKIGVIVRSRVDSDWLIDLVISPAWIFLERGLSLVVTLSKGAFVPSRVHEIWLLPAVMINVVVLFLGLVFELLFVLEFRFLMVNFLFWRLHDLSWSRPIPQVVSAIFIFKVLFLGVLFIREILVLLILRNLVLFGVLRERRNGRAELLLASHVQNFSCGRTH